MITYILSRVDSCEMSFHNTNLDLHQQEVVVTVINGIAWVEINGNAALRWTTMEDRNGYKDREGKHDMVSWIPFNSLYSKYA